MPVPYYNYIGKAQRTVEQAEGEALFHPLPYHLLDVAAVGWQVLNAKPELAADLAELLDISVHELRALLLFGLLQHDLGKMTASFQSLFEESGLARITLPAGVSYDSKNSRHDQLGYDVWQKVTLPEIFTQGNELRTKRKLRFYLGIFWGHHGKPVRNNATVHDSIRITPDDLLAAEAWLTDSLTLLAADFPHEKFNDRDFNNQLKRASWLLAGLATYCDWVGSDSDVFHYHDEPMDLAEYWNSHALPRALKAIQKTEVFDAIRVKPFPGFKATFQFSPSPLQAFAESAAVSDTPQLFILEDLTGAGKTEAALTLAHRLLAAGAGKGLYFGLPTMATSNAMFARVAVHYRNMLEGSGTTVPSIVLAHGARDLNEQFRQARLGASRLDAPYESAEETASIACGSWLADSRKKALLAPVGVGTIDQALLAVLPKRHQSLRVLGLYGKVLILDEVHAADAYMFELLDTLLTLHASQGGSVILLTATLPAHRRQRLTEIWQKALGQMPQTLECTGAADFPLATSVNVEVGLTESRIDCRPGTERRVAVEFLHSEQDCVELVRATAEAGKCVVWVRNSIDEAISAYQILRNSVEHPEHCQLFHSRFILQHRREKEAWVMEHFGPESTPEKRAGRILIATQVFQESLDADADLMISDLCLIDDLVQRAGRLHRHARTADGRRLHGQSDQREAPLLVVNAPEWQEVPDEDWLMRYSPNTQYVYRTPGRIWLTMKYLRSRGALELPAQAREMIEYVYAPDVVVPLSFESAEAEYHGMSRASSNQGRIVRLDLDSGYTTSSNQIWTDDSAEVGTRLGEESHEVLLVRKVNGAYMPVVEDREQGLELSTLRVSSRRLLAELSEIEAADRDAFIEKYPRARYSLIADIENIPGSYSEELGWAGEKIGEQN